MAALVEAALARDAGPAPSQDAGLAQQLANPVASLISVPFQFNFDSRIGPGDDGRRATLNIQPVVPIQINPEWNLISRTILPVISQSGFQIRFAAAVGRMSDARHHWPIHDPPHCRVRHYGGRPHLGEPRPFFKADPMEDARL
jgi:hypothetical protein